MFKRIINIITAVVFLIILFLGYKVFFDLPADPNQLANIQIGMGVTGLIFLVLLFLRLRIS